MPPFPERESSLLAKLKKKKPSAVVEEKKPNKPITVEVNNTAGESSTDVSNHKPRGQKAKYTFAFKNCLIVLSLCNNNNNIYHTCNAPGYSAHIIYCKVSGKKFE